MRKDDLRVSAYGTVDELSAFLGFALVEIRDSGVREVLAEIQNHLFDMGTELASPLDCAKSDKLPKLVERDEKKLEDRIDYFDGKLPPLKEFVLPGGGEGAARLHLARTVCRRAERILTTLYMQNSIRPVNLSYLNRLSDLLFVLARYMNYVQGVGDQPWEKKSNYAGD